MGAGEARYTPLALGSTLRYKAHSCSLGGNQVGSGGRRTMLPSWHDWIFSIKTFAGAMLALWIALRMGLDRPYWAMATAYIVAQPLTGAMRSKAAYRFFGTVLGAVATLVFIPN